MNSYNLKSMTILLQQHNIEKLVNKIQQNCEERKSIRYKSEAEDMDFFVSKPQQKQNGSHTHREPMSARSLYFTPVRTSRTNKQNKIQKFNTQFEDCFDQTDGDQSNLLTVILQLQEQIKRQNEEVNSLTERCSQLEKEREEALKPNVEEITMTAHLLQQNELLMQQLAKLKKQQQQ